MSLLRKRAAVGLTLALAVTGLTAPLASANPAGSGLVISEVYGGGGNSGATYTNDYIELYNPTAGAISVDGWSVQYRSAGGAGAGAVTPLTGTVAAGGHYLVQEAAGTAGTTALPNPDATGTIAMGGTGGQVWLSTGTTALTPPVGNVSAPADCAADCIIDFVGAGSAATSFETAKMATSPSNTTAASRNSAGKDTDNNFADFHTATPDPQNKGSVVDPPPPPPPAEPTRATIAEIQGTGDTSPLAGKTVITRGVVTATYPTGGFDGFYLQTDGTGGPDDATPGASDAVFVYGSSAVAGAAKGDFVEVTGKVNEHYGTTEITAAPGGVTELATTPTGVTALAAAYPTTEDGREAHEGELLAPTDRFTVTNTYSTNQYAEIGLATGDKPLIVPTEVADAQDSGAIADVEADNAARAVALDDGASINFLSSANQGIALPWLAKDNPIRVGAGATLTAPVILEYRNNNWKFQPTERVTDEGREVATFENTRTAAPEEVGGDLKLATFNVLNYFNTTGVEYAASGRGSCTYYADRTGDKVTDRDCGATGPRGAAEAEDLARQQAKIVAAINALDADIVSLEEIENSVALGEADRDDALSTLVIALNAKAGSTRWAYAPSPDASRLPPTSEQDVIRTAFIYDPATIDLVGASKVLVGSAAFGNAREPLAQAFKAHGTADSQAFAVIVNHFKSKGSGTADPYGQGNSTADRVAQAQALGSFAHSFAMESGTDKVFLTGDFNSYSMEDPMQVLYDDGYTAIDSVTDNEWTYSFSGMSGSLDHVLANDAALGLVTGADIWSINSGESVAFEYSRHNYNATDFYEPDVYRASDHDPEIVGITIPAKPVYRSTTVAATAPDMVYGTDGTVTATVTSDGTATGTVEVLEGSRRLGSADLVDGVAEVTVPGTTLAPGTYDLEVRYLGDDQHDPSATTVTLKVTKAAPELTATPQSRKLQVRKDSTTVAVTVAADGVTPTGYVLLVDETGTVLSAASLSGGKAVLRTGTFDTTGTKSLEVRYLGDDFVSVGTTAVSVDVVKGRPKK